MAYPGGAPVTIVGGQAGGPSAGTAANPFVTSTGATSPGGSNATPSFVKSASYTPLSDQTFTALDTTAKSLTVPGGATVAFVQNTGAGVVRYRFSGTPTASVGHQLAAGQVVTVDTGTAGLASFRMIDGSGTNSAFVSYFS